MFKVNVSPDMNMYSLLINQGYDPTYALCEFLDNSIHAFQEHSDLDVLEIDISFFSENYHVKKNRNSITISDKGPGIQKDLLKKALQPANKPSKIGLSEFGIGMKSAAVWFANEWILTTYPKGEGKKLTADFDLEKLLAEGKSILDVSEDSDDPSKHGTTIELIGLRKKLTREKFDVICKGIGDIYQKFIERPEKKVKINASFDGETLAVKNTYKGFPTLVAPTFVKRKNKTYTSGKDKEWKVTIDTEYQGHPVKGFIHLMDKGGYKKNPGLVMFRHDRVVIGTTDNHFKPDGIYGTSNKAASMRVQGELHLDNHPVSYTKDKFTFDEVDFSSHLLENVNGLRELLNQAENYRAGGADPLESDGEEKNGSPTANDIEDRAVDPEEGPTATGTSPTENTESNNDQSSDSDTTGSEQGGNSDDGEYDHINDRAETKIQRSGKIDLALKKSKSKKLYWLYSSLCTVSLRQHPTLMYVGAWSFFEVLARKCGYTNNDFTAFYSGKIIDWGFTKEDKKTFNVHLEDISKNGNTMKHHKDSMKVDAAQLANDFEVLEPLILSALEHVI
ncbi:ATP-binding protein [Alcanivorax sp.]|uniref:ATP-binding protein n=1 Tax=Alcanivorax sp. TaxID=1872427 RepID=UPI000C3B0B5A|nr:ATP-binding protein [Alcanivorax sp.]MBU86036.1 hypothetical protein [Alcanivorax sp.]